MRYLILLICLFIAIAIPKAEATFQPTSGLGNWTLLNFASFDIPSGFSGAAEGASSTTNNYATSPAPPFPDYITNTLCFQQTIGGNNFISNWTNTGQTNFFIADWVYFQNNFDPPIDGSGFDLLAISDVFAGQLCRLELINDGGTVELNLYDSPDAEVATKANPDFSVDTWHFLELFVQGDAQGNAEVWIDGVSQLTAALEDFDPGGYTRIRYKLEGQGGVGVLEAPTTVYWSNNLFASTTQNTGIDLTRLGEFHTIRYMIGKTTNVPDYDGTAFGTGGREDNLDSGNWEDASDDSSSDDCLYTAGHEGAVLLDDTDNYGEPGPLGSAATNNDIIAGKWLWNYSLQAGRFSKWRGILGLKAGASVGISQTLALSASGSDLYYQTLKKRGVGGTRRLPFMDEYFIIGFYNNSGSPADAYLKEAWCFLLVRTPVEPYVLPLIKPIGDVTILGDITLP